MNADIFKGKWGQFKGELKTSMGKNYRRRSGPDRRQLREVPGQGAGTVRDSEGRYCRLGGQVVSRHQAGSSGTRTGQITFM